MLTITVIDGRSVSFNLKSFERECSLRDAWRAMHGDPKYAGKKFRIGTTDGDSFEFPVDSITSIEHEPAEYFKVDAEDVIVGTKGRSASQSEAQKASAAFSALEEARVNKFLSYIKQQGVEPDYTDTTFMTALKYAKESPDWKIPMYANIWLNTRSK